MNDKIYGFLRVIQELEKILKQFDTSSDFIKNLIKLGYVQYDTTAPILNIRVTEKGIEELNKWILSNENKKDLPPNFDFLLNLSDSSTYVRGAARPGLNKDMIKEISEDTIYRFLKFHIGVLKRTRSPYLRELVAEDYLIDIEDLSYEQSAKLINHLVKEGILEYDQFGAFPGTGVSEKGYTYFKRLEKKWGNSKKDYPNK